MTEELEESKIDRLAYQFNRGYKEALASVNFILDFKNSIVSQNDIVLDESGFANVIGAEDFCNLLKGRIETEWPSCRVLMQLRRQTNQIAQYEEVIKNMTYPK